MNSDPTLMFYCQHSLGMGHLVRSFSLAAALSQYFRVLFLNGGPVPDNLQAPEKIDVINLPPLGMSLDGRLVSRSNRHTVEEAKAARRQKMLQLFRQVQPSVLLIELFPFGRKKFADELVPLLELAHANKKNGPTIFCSLRDILVGRGGGQQDHDDRAANCVNQYFDAVLIHSDPCFARLDESFHPTVPLEVEAIHTGFVSPDTSASNHHVVRSEGILVSAGGGFVGLPLFKAALAAQPELYHVDRLPMTLVAGPFLPEQDWRTLQEQARALEGIHVLRSVPNLRKLLIFHSRSVSQCGYNTMLDIVATQPAALVVPFSTGEEDEQLNRAQRLQRIGLLRYLEASKLSRESLIHSIRTLPTHRSVRSVLDVQGAKYTAEIIADWEKNGSRSFNNVPRMQGTCR